MRQRTGQRDWGLVQELLRNHRVMLQVLSFLLVLAVATAGYTILGAQARLERYIAMAYSARNVQISMLDQSGAIRGWIATGEPAFLATYRTAKSQGDDAFAELVGQVEDDDTAGLTEAVLRTAVARKAWFDWADSAVASDATDSGTDHEVVADLLIDGRRLFEEYRAASDVSTDMLVDRRDDALASARTALLVGVGIFVLVLVATAVAAVRGRRRLTLEVIAPINDLLATIDRLRDGDLTARNPESRVRELDAIGVALSGLATSLDTARTEAEAREARLAALAGRFETVVRVGREIAGSLSVRYVAAAVTSAAAELLGTPAVLWVRGEDQVFHAVSRSIDPHGAIPPVDLAPAEVVAVSAADARPTAQGERRAYPLVLAGMVVGVLETGQVEVDSDTDQVLQALLSTAAASLESAHLHSVSRELAEMDALTGLPNRRRFESDIEHEWERCRRYGRPMSVVMVDLDHFKELNDTNGHLYGDEVLRGAALAMGAVLRTSDTAYRYGGEEFVVLLRETGLENGVAVAERIRTAVEHFSLRGRSAVVTASAGVAERTGAMAHHTELVERADVALYEAKAGGRNRVVAGAVLAD